MTTQTNTPDYKQAAEDMKPLIEEIRRIKGEQKIKSVTFDEFLGMSTEAVISEEGMYIIDRAVSLCVDYAENEHYQAIKVLFEKVREIRKKYYIPPPPKEEKPATQDPKKKSKEKAKEIDEDDAFDHQMSTLTLKRKKLDHHADISSILCDAYEKIIRLLERSKKSGKE